MLLNNLLVALLATSPVAVFAAPVASPDNSLARRELDSAVLTNRATDIDPATIDMVKRQLVPLPGDPRFANLFKTSKDLVKRLEVGVTTPAEIDEILASANLDEDLGKRQVDPAAVNGYFTH
ncbi:alcohol dehydrogenase [acceptor] [Physcia stellaris]|nr:alcohol dehydrogenase [acceptor] [Physcia stellaris]